MLETMRSMCDGELLLVVVEAIQRMPFYSFDKCTMVQDGPLLPGASA